MTNQPDGGPEKEVQDKTKAVSSKEVEGVKTEKKDSLAILSESLLQSNGEPLRLLKWAETMEKAAAGIDGDVVKLKLRIKACEEETEKECELRAAAEILRVGLLEKLDLNRHTIEKREVDVAMVKKNLEIARALHHDLITRKVRVLWISA